MNWISPGERLPHDTLDVCTLWLCFGCGRVIKGGYRQPELDQPPREGKFFDADGVHIDKIAWWRPMRTGDPPPPPPKE
jgi:hypothetical protein